MDDISKKRDKFKGGIWSAWKVGDTDNSGEEIERVLGYSHYYYVYSVKNGWLRWQYQHDCIYDPHRIEAEVQILLNKGKSNLTSSSDFKRFRLLIASGMVHAFNDHKKGMDHREFFSEAEEFLEKNSNSKYKLIYFLTSSFTAFLFMVLLISLLYFTPTWVSEAQQHLVIGGISGCFGAFMSILQRFDELGKELSHYVGKEKVIIESLSRLMIGLGFGAILIVCQKSGLLLSIADENIYLLALGGILAGFNERFVPSLLSGAENSLTNKS